MACEQKTSTENMFQLYNIASEKCKQYLLNNGKLKCGIILSNSNIVHDGCTISSIILTLQVLDNKNNVIYKEMLTQEHEYSRNFLTILDFDKFLKTEKAWH